MALSPYDLLPAVVSFALALAFTPLVRALAFRWGMVVHPRSDRWHRRPTAMLGGVAIFAAVASACLTVAPRQPHVLLVLGVSAFLFLVGLVDDLRPLKPYQKVIGQIMGAALVVSGGLVLPWTANPAVNAALTIFWLVGITNAINLLDNMDGLAAGVAAIASATLVLTLVDAGQTAEACIVAVFAAALVGFLVWNFSPASIFMGDCGSMFIGFFLASSALLHNGGGRSRSLLAVLAVPVLTLGIPIFDTTLVTLLRKLAGRAVSQGGRDHASHRLVALGLSERRAVCLLYVLAALAGAAALLVRHLEWDVSVAVILCLTLALTFLGVYLSRVKVYGEGEAGGSAGRPLVTFLVNLSYKRRVFEVLLDAILILLAYYAASRLVVGSLAENGAWEPVVQCMAVLVFVKMAVFLSLGVYRGVWRYAGIADVVTYAKAVGLSSVLSAVALLLLHFEYLSRTVFVLDMLILLTLIGGSRLAFRLLRRLLPGPVARTGRRVLIYGAGDGGELLLRELHNNRSLGYVAIGFADDNPLKHGTVIHGLRVFGGNGSLAGICRQQRVEEVLISSTRFTEERVEEIKQVCLAAGVNLKRMCFQIEQLTDAGSR